LVVLAVLVVIATVAAVAIAVLSGDEPRSSPGAWSAVTHGRP